VGCRFNVVPTIHPTGRGRCPRWKFFTLISRKRWRIRCRNQWKSDRKPTLRCPFIEVRTLPHTERGAPAHTAPAKNYKNYAHLSRKRCEIRRWTMDPLTFVAVWCTCRALIALCWSHGAWRRADVAKVGLPAWNGRTDKRQAHGDSIQRASIASCDKNGEDAVVNRQMGQYTWRKKDKIWENDLALSAGLKGGQRTGKQTDRQTHGDVLRRVDMQVLDLRPNDALPM